MLTSDEKDAKETKPDIVIRKNNGKEVEVDLDLKEWVVVGIVISIALIAYIVSRF